MSSFSATNAHVCYFRTMFSKLLRNDWLALRRSSFWTQSLVQTIILGVFALYMLLQFTLLGFLGGKLIAELFPDENPVSVVNRALIYYFLADLLLRFFFQKYPSLQLQPYLTMNIKKRQLAQYLCAKSLVSIFNVAPLFFVIPFYFWTVQPEIGVGAGLHWLLMMLLLIGIVHYGSYWIDRNLGKSPALSLGLLGLSVLFLTLDYHGYFSLSKICEPFFTYVHQHLVGLLGLGLTLFLLYRVVYLFLRRNAYVEVGPADSKARNVQDFAFFNQFGPEVGKLMQLEAKLIWRNRRSKAYLTISFIFLLYPLLLLQSDLLDSNAMLILVGLLITGAFSLNYGQLLLSWNSTHFDFILAQNIRIEDYFQAKFTLLALSNVVLYVLSLPYAFFFPKMLLVNTVMFSFNTGITIFAYLFLALYSSRKMDMNKGGAFSFEGFGAAHYLIMFPLMFAPIFIYMIFRFIDQRTMGLIVIGLLGLLGLALRKYIMKKAIDKFAERKYRIGAKFKQ